MKKIITRSLVLAASISVITACTKAEVGTGVGAVGGAGLASAASGGNPWWTAAGAVGGAWAGNRIGDDMDRRDYERYRRRGY